MKTSTFNRIFENARSVNIQSNEWFNYAGFFWMQCTEKQLAKMRMLLKAQGCKTTVKNGEEWYILNSGTLIKVHCGGRRDDLHHGKAALLRKRLDGITLGSARVFAPMPERRPPGRQAGLQLQSKERGFRIL